MEDYLRVLARDQGILRPLVSHETKEDFIVLKEGARVYFGTEISFEVSSSG
jgi:hypothetical protein